MNILCLLFLKTNANSNEYHIHPVKHIRRLFGEFTNTYENSSARNDQWSFEDLPDIIYSRMLICSFLASLLLQYNAVPK